MVIEASKPARTDWEALVRDQAHEVRWIDERTVWLLPNRPDMQVVAVDVETGVRRELGDRATAERDHKPAVAPDDANAGKDGRAGAPADTNIGARTGARSDARKRTRAGRDASSHAESSSPSGAHTVKWEVVAAQRRPVTLVENAPLDQVQPKVRTIDYLKPGDQIEQRWPQLFSSDGSVVPVDRALFANPWAIDHCRWSEDGSTFYLRYNQRGHQVLRLCAIDARTGAVRTVVEDAPDSFVDYAAKGWMRWLDEEQLLWMSERDGWNHCYLVDARTGAVVRQVTDGKWSVRRVHSVDDDAGEHRTITCEVMGMDPEQDPYHRHWVRVNIDTGELVRLTQGDGTHSIDWSPDGTHYVDTWSRIDHPRVRELRRTSDGALVTELARADISEVLAGGWTMPERFVAKGRDGETDIWGAIWRPVETLSEQGEVGARARSFPVVENIYAGPHDHFVPKSFSVWHGQREFTRDGCITVQVDGMGTNWRGKAFHDVAWKNLGDSGLPDHVLWLRAAAAKHPEMDLSRVGIYGGSAGGQSAMRALLDYPHMYKVGVADCGCHDNRMDKIWWNELWMGWPVDASYERSSNVVDAAKLQGKLMLIVGELDENVDPASTMQVAAALSRAGKDFELVVVPSAGHGAAGTTIGARKQREFMLRHLFGP